MPKIHLLQLIVFFIILSCQTPATTDEAYNNDSKDQQTSPDEYDVAAYVWPAYHHEPRMKEFYRGDDGEWERIYQAKPKWEAHDQPRVPLWGYVDEDDPEVMEMKIETAHEYGVDIFIYDWYWYENQPYLEEALNEGFLKANNNHLMKFYLMWANHDANTSWDIDRSHDQQVIWPGDVDRPTFETVVERVINQYFKHPSYYKINGEPVFSIYHLPNLVKGLGGLEETRAAIQYFREEVKKAGFPGLHLQVTFRNNLLKNVTGVDGNNADDNLNKIIEAMEANSITSYQWIHHLSAGRDYVEWGSKAWESMEQIDQKLDIPYYVHVSIGWDNNPRFVEPKDIVYNTTPQSFEAFLLKAKEYADQRPDEQKLITINSWNEWVEGSYLEPDMRWSYGYLEAVKKVFGEEQ